MYRTVTEKDRRSDQMSMDQTRPGVGPFPEEKIKLVFNYIMSKN